MSCYYEHLVDVLEVMLLPLMVIREAGAYFDEVTVVLVLECFVLSGPFISYVDRAQRLNSVLLRK